MVKAHVVLRVKINFNFGKFVRLLLNCIHSDFVIIVCKEIGLPHFRNSGLVLFVNETISIVAESHYFNILIYIFVLILLP